MVGLWNLLFGLAAVAAELGKKEIRVPWLLAVVVLLFAGTGGWFAHDSFWEDSREESSGVEQAVNQTVWIEFDPTMFDPGDSQGPLEGAEAPRAVSVRIPSPGERVEGRFTVSGSSTGLEGKQLFLLLRDTASDLYFIQRGFIVKGDGEWSTEAFACIGGAEYEIVIVYPSTDDAQAAYKDWLANSSGIGRKEIPGNTSCRVPYGGTRVVTPKTLSDALPDECEGISTPLP